jgi:hypothetical protein
MARRFGSNDYNPTAVFTILAIWLVGLIGWIMNIIAIWNTMDNTVTAKFVLRVVGIFVAPIGAILGFVG